MNAIQLLKDDHNKVRELLEALEATSRRASKKRTDLLAVIAREVENHTTIEEEIFYPAFRTAGEKGDDEQLYFEALEEHRAAGDLVLPDLQRTAPDSDQFGGRAKVLKELIEHHIQEEEREMFPRARKVLSAAELRELGDRMEERKKQLLSATKAGSAASRKTSSKTAGGSTNTNRMDDDDVAGDNGLDGARARRRPPAALRPGGARART